MLAWWPEPEAHDKVLDNNPDQNGIWKTCWFLRRGENRSIQRKTSQSKKESKQQTQPKFDAGSESQIRDTLVEGSVLSPLQHHWLKFFIALFTEISIPLPCVDVLGAWTHQHYPPRNSGFDSYFLINVLALETNNPGSIVVYMPGGLCRA